jgi:hypothetical protein
MPTADPSMGEYLNGASGFPRCLQMDPGRVALARCRYCIRRDALAELRCNGCRFDLRNTARSRTINVQHERWCEGRNKRAQVFRRQNLRNISLETLFAPSWFSTPLATNPHNPLLVFLFFLPLDLLLQKEQFRSQLCATHDGDAAAGRGTLCQEVCRCWEGASPD